MNPNKKESFLLNENIIDAFILLIVSIAMMIYSLKNHYGIPQLKWALSPYLFPFLISIFILLLAIMLICEGTRRKEITGHNRRDGINHKDAIVIIMISIIYLTVLKQFGFIISSIAFLIALFLYLGEKRIWLILLISAAAVFMIYIIFGILLHVMLP